MDVCKPLITGRELPNNVDAACLVGSVLVPAVPVSSALVLCDPFSIPSLDRATVGRCRLTL